MTILLAKLDTIKADLDGTSDESVLIPALEKASAKAEELARRPIAWRSAVEYPCPMDATRELLLELRPVGEVASIKQLSSPSSDAEFTAATALAEWDDYIIDHERGVIEHQSGYWHPRRRLVQVTLTGGYIGPDGLPGELTTEALATEAEIEIDIAVEMGDTLYVGTEIHTVQSVAGAGPYAIGLASGLAADHASGVAVKHYPAEAVIAPDYLQAGVLQHATRLYNTRDTAGVREIDLGEGGGRVSFGECKTHPSLIDAVMALPGRRITL